MGLVGDLTHDPGRHHQAVVAVERRGQRLDLLGEPDLCVGAVPGLDVAEQRLLSSRVELDPPTAQQPPEPTHVASFQQSRRGRRRC